MKFGKKKKELEKINIHAQVKECCEKIVVASKKIEEARTEYNILKTYYDDVLILEDLPNTSRDEIFLYAKKIKTADDERLGIENSAVKITKDKYEYVKENEGVISKSIARMSEDEKRLGLVKSDLNNLEGEKEALKIEKHELKNKLNVLQNISKLAIILLMIIFVICIILALVFDFDPKLLVFVSIAIATLTAFIIFVAHRRILRLIRTTDAKLNKVIGLLNKVKLKYVNVVSTLDYVYKKNNVNSSYELSSLWGNYITSKKDKDIYDMVMDKLYTLSEKLIDLLSEYNLKEPEIWVSQAGNLSDATELKNYRIELLRKISQAQDAIENNTKIVEKTKQEIEAFIKKKGIEPKEIINIIKNYENIL